MSDATPAGGTPPKAAAASSGSAGADRGKRSRKPKKQRKHPILFGIFKWGSITAVTLFVALAVAGYVVYRSVDVPTPNADFQTETTNVYYSDGETLIGTFETQNRQSVELDQIPDFLQDAAISAEDRSFYDNQGLDLKGIVRAATNNATSDTTQGASTITQQYVKILYLTQDRTWSRKIKEAILSVKINDELSKEDILAGYLNTIYFGRGAYGVQTAAQAYFEKDVEDLSLQQSAVLASLIQSPSGLDPNNGKAARTELLGRYQYVLDGMVEAGAVDQSRVDKVYDRLPDFPDIEASDRFGGVKGYLLRLTEQQLKAEGFSDDEINGGGLQVTTTFDVQAQKAARDAVKEERPEGTEFAGGKNGMKGLHIAISSVDPSDGAVRAMYGGPDYITSQYNWATARVQPGSTFKVFALAAALENGFSLDSTLNGSSPLYLDGGESVSNQGDSGGESYGYISLLSAVENSVNTAFVDLTEQMEDGPAKIIDAADRAGIDTQQVFNGVPDGGEVPSVSLGFAPTSNLQMADAYATFANGGEHNDSYVVEEVTDSDGAVLYEHNPTPEREFSRDVAADVTYALNQTATTYGATATAANTICPTAAKTGTATQPDSNDPDAGEHVSSAWLVGYTPKLATAVTYSRGATGNEDLEYQNAPEGNYEPFMPEGFYGGTYPAQTFKAYMDAALDGRECGDFPDAADIQADTESYTPTYVPTEEPTYEPTDEPTLDPSTGDPTTEEPTDDPTTEEPTDDPTTEEPTDDPTTEEPTDDPTTEDPTTEPPPTEEPTTEPPPTEEPTTEPPPTTDPGDPGDGGGGGDGGGDGGLL